MSTAWESLGGLQQQALGSYGNIAVFLKDPRSGDPQFQDTCKDMQGALTNTIFGFPIGINDKVAAPLNEALADPKNRDAVFKLAHDDPAALNATIQEIKQSPEQTASIIASLKPKEVMGADGKMHPVTADGDPSRPATAAATPGVGSALPDATASPDDPTASTASRPGTQASAGKPAASESPWDKIVDLFKEIGKWFEKILETAISWIAGLFMGNPSSHGAPAAGQTSPHPQAPSNEYPYPAHAAGISPAAKPSQQAAYEEYPYPASPNTSSTGMSPAAHTAATSQVPSASDEYPYPTSVGLPANVKALARPASDGLLAAGVMPTANGLSDIVSGAKAAPVEALTH